METSLRGQKAAALVHKYQRGGDWMEAENIVSKINPPLDVFVYGLKWGVKILILKTAVHMHANFRWITFQWLIFAGGESFFFFLFFYINKAHFKILQEHHSDKGHFKVKGSPVSATGHHSGPNTT